MAGVIMQNPLKIALKVMSGWRTKSRPQHQGIDLAAPVGTPVYAARSGKVKLVTGNTGAPGNSIIILVTADDEDRYNHLKNRPDFEDGDRVTEGQLIGHVGMTGKTSAPHLHFARYRLVKGAWKDVDPTTYLDFAATASTTNHPFDPEEDDMPITILERTKSDKDTSPENLDSAAAKSLYNPTTGKAVRKISKDENSSFRRAEPGTVVYITVGPSEYRERGGF